MWRRKHRSFSIPTAAPSSPSIPYQTAKKRERERALPCTHTQRRTRESIALDLCAQSLTKKELLSGFFSLFFFDKIHRDDNTKNLGQTCVTTQVWLYMIPRLEKYINISYYVQKSKKKKELSSSSCSIWSSSSDLAVTVEAFTCSLLFHYCSAA